MSESSMRSPYDKNTEAVNCSFSYLTMTGGQTALQLSDSAIDGDDDGPGRQLIKRLPDNREKLPVIGATPEEIAAHEAQLDLIAMQSGGRVLWRELIK